MKKLILVVDMLNGFAKEGNLASENVKKIIEPIEKYLLKNKNEENIFICDSHYADDIEMQVYPLHCLKNSGEDEIVEELKPYAKLIVLKNSTNSFHILNKKITLTNYDQFEIVGCCTDICILQLAISLKTFFNENKINKNVIVYDELTSTYDGPNHNAKEYHKFALEIMKQTGIIIK
ncbi:isochorismatase family cysteine hydrolase [Mycoplasmopsis hyopharyngis]|uniref:isochorismatase family cysteine hydrolase n=1 Tax=Mycoplasmopsis hyopharyngis TaxID=29558 RepID=UPI003873C171